MQTCAFWCIEKCTPLFWCTYWKVQTQVYFDVLRSTNLSVFWCIEKCNCNSLSCPPGQLAPGGEDNQGGGQDIPRQLATRGTSQPRLACPPGGKLSRGQDKLGHHPLFWCIGRCKPECMLVHRKVQTEVYFGALRSANLSVFWCITMILFCLFYSRIQAAFPIQNRPVSSQFWDFSLPEDFIGIYSQFKRHRLYPKKGNKITVSWSANPSIFGCTEKWKPYFDVLRKANLSVFW